MENDFFYLKFCKDVALKSKCNTKKLGAVLVIDDTIVCTGVNGPAKGIPECSNRIEKDPVLMEVIKKSEISEDRIRHAIVVKQCPRELFGFVNGQGLEYCNAIHAELNCLLSATRMGIATKGGTLYLSNDEAPCSQCFSACIQAGIKEIVVVKIKAIDPTVDWCMNNSNILVREFEI